MAQPRKWIERFSRLSGVAVVILAFVAGAWFFAGKSRSQPPATASAPEKKDSEPPVKIRRIGADTIIVPQDIQTSLGVKTGAVTTPSQKRKLPSFQGTLNFDSNRLARVQSHFAGPVVELGTVPETAHSALPTESPATTHRALRVGDHVQQGDLLAVVWSKDLGEKKSEFIDAISKLRTDEETYRRLDGLYGMGATPERSVRDAERAVKADHIAVERAEATLKAWRILPAEIADLKAQAERLSAVDAKPSDPTKWARVEIRAPLSGVILEKNLAVGQLVDSTTDLFRIGDLSVLAVWLHVYEEDVPELQKVPTPSPWVVSVPSRPGSAYPGQLELVAAAIDPNQHTALVTGTVDNKSGELRAGMFVTVTIELPPATGELEIPAEAVVESGRESVVFVRQTSDATKFVRQQVRVLRRGRDIISVVAEPGGLRSGDQIITAGSLLLSEAVADLPQT